MPLIWRVLHPALSHRSRYRAFRQVLMQQALPLRLSALVAVLLLFGDAGAVNDDRRSVRSLSGPNFATLEDTTPENVCRHYRLPDPLSSDTSVELLVAGSEDGVIGLSFGDGQASNQSNPCLDKGGGKGPRLCVAMGGTIQWADEGSTPKISSSLEHTLQVKVDRHNTLQIRFGGRLILSTQLQNTTLLNFEFCSKLKVRRAHMVSQHRDDKEGTTSMHVSGIASMFSYGKRQWKFVAAVALSLLIGGLCWLRRSPQEQEVVHDQHPDAYHDVGFSHVDGSRTM